MSLPIWQKSSRHVCAITFLPHGTHLRLFPEILFWIFFVVCSQLSFRMAPTFVRFLIFYSVPTKDPLNLTFNIFWDHFGAFWTIRYLDRLRLIRSVFCQ